MNFKNPECRPIGTPVEPVLYGFDGTATYREHLIT